MRGLTPSHLQCRHFPKKNTPRQVWIAIKIPKHNAKDAMNTNAFVKNENWLKIGAPAIIQDAAAEIAINAIGFTK